MSWSLYGQLRGGNGHIRRTAWIPATGVHPSDNPEEQRKYPDVPRLDLAADPHSWPAAARRINQPQHDYGRLTRRPPPPHGISVLSGEYPPPDSHRHPLTPPKAPPS